MAIDAAAGLKGGCQCGAVRYRLMGEPTGVNICHCRMCQKASGGPFMAFGGVRMSEFAVSRGVVSTFASSDIAERGFCGQCGTPLTYHRLGSDRVSVTLVAARARRSGDECRTMAGAGEDSNRAQSPASGSGSLNAARGSRGKENTNERRLHL